MAIRRALRSGCIEVAVLEVAVLGGVMAIPIRLAMAIRGALRSGCIRSGCIESGCIRRGHGHGYSKGLGYTYSRGSYLFDWPYVFDWPWLYEGPYEVAILKWLYS